MNISKFKVADSAFFGLLFCIYVSLNSITALYFGISQVASPLILLFCLLIISILGVSRTSFNNIGVKLLYGVFLSYYIIGFFTRLFLTDVGYRVSLFGQLLAFVTSLIIIVSVHQYMYKRLIIDKREITVFNSLYVPVILSNLYSIYQSITGQLISEYGYAQRASGVFANPNALGFIANVGLILTFYSLYNHKKYFFIKLILLPTLFYISFLSLSRASLITSLALITLGTGWMLINLLKLGRSARWKSFLVIGLPITLITYVVLNFESLLNKYLDQWQAKKVMTIVDLVFKGKINSETTSGRTEVVEFGMQMIEKRPIFGNGLGFFQYFPAELGFRHGVHNTYLLIQGDSGIIAFTIFIIFMFYVFIKSFFIKPLPGLLSFGCMLVWAMQNLSGHNGLDDKMSNILITFSVLYLSTCNHKKSHIVM